MNPKAQGSGALLPNGAESQGPQLVGAPGGSTKQRTEGRTEGRPGSSRRVAAPQRAEPPAWCSELRLWQLWEPRATAFRKKCLLLFS